MGASDLKLLSEAYASMGAFSEFTDYADNPISDFYNIWSSDDTPGSLKGLFLGYPIDVTMSFYSLQ